METLPPAAAPSDAASLGIAAFHREPLRREPLHREQIRRAVIGGSAAAAAYFAAVCLLFGGWVHFFYAGHYGGPLMISTLLGISEASVRAGAHPVYEPPQAGWDGQYYYTQANDPLLENDYSDGRLFDLPSYRYTRNGLPLLAKAASMLIGKPLVTPWVYFTTQFFFAAAGFGLLVAWLVYHRRPWYWALVWGLYGGVLRPMLHGLPDPTADALFLVSILAALDGRLWLYTAAASVLCLCRESYAAPAAVLWAMTVAGKFDWRGQAGYYTRIAATAVPGVVVLGWAFYVANQLNTEVLAGSRHFPWGALVDWPFKAYLACLWSDITSEVPVGSRRDIVQATSCALCLLVVFAIVLKQVRHSVKFAPLVPHILLMTMTGYIVWDGGLGFFKNASSVVLLGVVLLPRTPSKLLRGSLLFTFVAGLQFVHTHDWSHLNFTPPLAAVPLNPPILGQAAIVPTPPTLDYQSRVELVGREAEEPAYRGPFAPWHRSPGLVVIRITNTSSVAWPATMPGVDAISLGVKFCKGDRLEFEDRLPLYKAVPVGETIDYRVRVPVRSDGLMPNTLYVGMIHDAHRWFSLEDPCQILAVPY